MTHLSVVKTAGRQQFIGLYSNLLGSKSREGRALKGTQSLETSWKNVQNQEDRHPIKSGWC